MKIEAVLFSIACVVAGVIPLLTSQSTLATTEGFPGWPSHYLGKELQTLSLNALEHRFAQEFPGQVSRFSDGEREIVMRWVARETRKLHPAADCFRATGYTLTARPIEVDSQGQRWGRFTAKRNDQRLDVRERIYDNAGNSWTDVSAWYWSAVRQQTFPPWWVLTVASNSAVP